MGYIYIIINTALKDMVKIGYVKDSTKNSIERISANKQVEGKNLVCWKFATLLKKYKQIAKGEYVGLSSHDFKICTSIISSIK